MRRVEDVTSRVQVAARMVERGRRSVRYALAPLAPPPGLKSPVNHLYGSLIKHEQSVTSLQKCKIQNIPKQFTAQSLLRELEREN